MILSLLLLAIQLYVLVLLARMLLSWFPPPSEGGFLTVYRFVFDLTEPPLRAIRGVIPPLRLGAMALDLSPIILIIGLQILASLVRRL